MLNKNLIQPRCYRYTRQVLAALALLLVSASSFAVEDQSITIRSASFSLQDKTYLLNAHIDYSLSDEAIEALHNGVTLTFNVELSIIEPRSWLWNKHISSLTLPYRIKYHTLAETYQVSDTTNNLQHNFSSLSAALHALGTVDDTPIHAMTSSNAFTANGSLKAYLNIEALPLPMRPLAYITAGWYLRSKTFQWPLTQ